MSERPTAEEINANLQGIMRGAIESRTNDIIEELESFTASNPVKARDRQVGGDHYKEMPIQPMDYSMANGLDACQHTAIKYVTRFRSKGGLRDLQKAIHVIEMLIEYELDAGTPDNRE